MCIRDREAYIKRLNDLEQLAMSYPGVIKTYAIQAGRELRVIVGADKIDDVETECMHATWSGNKCTDCGATIEITGMKYVGDEAVYDAETNTYTILISPSAGMAAPHVQFIGKNLEYYSKNHPCAEMLMIYQSDTEFGEYEDYLYYGV